MKSRVYLVEQSKPYDAEPPDVEAAKKERQAVVTEIQEISAFFNGVGADYISSKEHDRLANEKKKRLVVLQARAGFLRRWFRSKNDGFEGFHPNLKLLARCYRFLSEHEDVLADSDLEALLAEIEGQVPMTLLERK